MKKNLLKVLCMSKRSKKNKQEEIQVIDEPIPSDPVSTSNSSNYSVSSASSSNDSSSRPKTPTDLEIQEGRGIFRTLEPVWYFHSSLLPNNFLQNTYEWLRFDDHSQYMLENSLQNSEIECSLSNTIIGHCNVSFKESARYKKNATDRHTMILLSSSKKKSMPNIPHTRVLELYKDIQRKISPVWWFEQDFADGSKGMCRFDYKNQVRLEALSEGRSHFVLTDDSFIDPVTVVLNDPKQRELKEEIRGFLYFESGIQSNFAKNVQNEYESSHPLLVRRNSI